MTIAAHIVVKPGSTPSFLSETLGRLAIQYPGYHFIFFIDREAVNYLVPSANCTPVIISPAIKNSLLLHYWYNYKLPALLSRYDASVFLSENGMACIRAEQPQSLILPGHFLQSTKSGRFSRYLRKFFPSFFNKAIFVCPTDPFTTLALAQQYPGLTEKIRPVNHGLNELYKPMNWETKEAFLQDKANGKDYFLFYVNAYSRQFILPVVKAFSQFKKWQKSSLQLALWLEGVQQENLVPDMANYKYREEIIFHSSETTDKTKLVEAAYAAISLPAPGMVEQDGLHALQAAVPLLTLDDPATAARYNDAAIYCQPELNSLSEKMMRIYKDETLRNEHINRGLVVVAAYNWDQAADQLMQIIRKTTESVIH